MRAEGHEVESVITLRMQGLDNGKLCEFARQNFGVGSTRDFGFTHNVRQGRPPENFQRLRVTLEQKPQDGFIKDFIAAFPAADLNQYQHGDNWP